MKILGIEHLGIAVEDLAQDSPFWKHVLNLDATDQKLREKVNKKLIFGIL